MHWLHTIVDCLLFAFFWWKVLDLEAQVIILRDSYRTSAPVEKPEVPRSQLRRELCVKAVFYAEQIGGSGPEKLVHALAYAVKLDELDNGKRDFTDTELRLEIESVVGQVNSPEVKAA